MSRYVVTAGYVTVQTELPGGGRAYVDVQRGDLLPEDVPQIEVDNELRNGTIRAVDVPEPESATGPDSVAEAPSGPAGGGSVPEAMPAGMSVPTTQEWVGTDLIRARIALDAEMASTSPRSTLVDRLSKLLA